MVTCTGNLAQKVWPNRSGGLLSYEIVTSRPLKNSPRLADEARVVAHVEVEVANEAAGGSHGDPAAAGALVALVDALPGELGDRPTGAGVVADVEPGLDGDEAHLAFLPLDLEKSRLDEI